MLNDQSGNGNGHALFLITPVETCSECSECGQQLFCITDLHAAFKEQNLKDALKANLC